MSNVLNAGEGEAAFPKAIPIPMSRESKGKIRIADAMRRWCFQVWGPNLKAVILTGSLARNEATFREEDGVVHFLSDAEFVVILHDRAELPPKQTSLLICRGAEDELRNQGVECKLDLGAVRESYLSNLGETIFGYELLTCGEVVYGDPEIVLARARIATRKISLEDGWRLLANRTVELLEILPELSAGGAFLSEGAQYRLTKLYLDMATSLLVFKREFVAGYTARAQALCELRERDTLGDLPFNADRFIEIVRRCAAYKITSMWAGDSPFAERECVGRAIADLLNLWSWELARMNGVETDSPDVLLSVHMRRQRMRARLRGWLYAVRREGPGASLRYTMSWLRLSRWASPRYCVYRAALNVWMNLSINGADELKVDGSAARVWLPVPEPDLEGKHILAGLVDAILWNYHEFLVGTRS